MDKSRALPVDLSIGLRASHKLRGQRKGSARGEEDINNP
jgi:hypothetical protein